MRDERPPKASLADSVYEQLKAMAVTYRFRPDERLNEMALARQLNVSRTPLREALNRLVKENLLTFRPKQGFRGRPLDAKEVFDLYELRKVLETTAGRLAVQRARDDEIVRLGEFLKTSLEAPNEAPITYLLYLDEEFHERIARLSRNDELVKTLANINARIRFVRCIDMENGRRAKTQREHKAVFEALKRRNADACAKIIGHHITRRLDQIVEVIKEGFARIYVGEHPFDPSGPEAPTPAKEVPMS